MATNHIQDGKKPYLVTITGAKSGDAFVVGDYLPCVLLTDADANDSHKATVATEGVFSLSAKGDVSAISAGDLLYWADKDTPLDKTSAGKKPFGIALEASTHASNAIAVMLVPKATVPDSVGTSDIDSKAVTLAKMADLAETNILVGSDGNRPVARAVSGDATLSNAGALTIGAAAVTLAKLHGDVSKYISRAIDDPGDGLAIPVTASGVCALTTTEAGGETRTLAIPAFVGQQLTLTLDVDGGDCVVTVAAAVNVTGNNTLTLDNAGETIVLVGTQVAGALVWRVAANDGVTPSTV